MRAVGVDPGVNGAIAVWDGKKLEIWDMPSVKSRGRGNEINIPALIKILKKISHMDVDGAFVEQVQGRPKEGAGSARKAGISFGLVVGGLSLATLIVFRVRASEWKKAMRLTKDKRYSLTKALEIFPEYGHYFERVKDHDRAEAALLAYYGRNQLRKRVGTRKRLAALPGKIRL